MTCTSELNKSLIWFVLIINVHRDSKVFHNKKKSSLLLTNRFQNLSIIIFFESLYDASNNNFELFYKWSLTTRANLLVCNAVFRLCIFQI